MNLSDVLRNTSIKLNIMLATEKEKNYDMGSIVSAYGSYRLPDPEYLTDDILDNRFISFTKNTMVGIFNEWSGCGGPLGIELEKDFVFPLHMVRNIQLEGAKERYSYQVGDTYGLWGGCWKETISFTDQIPELLTEDLAQFGRFFEIGKADSGK